MLTKNTGASWMWFRLASCLPALIVSGCLGSPEGLGDRSANGADAVDIALQENPEVKGWRYSVQRDEMRGTDMKIAKLQAENYNPYSTPTLTIWKRADARMGAQLQGPLVVNSTGPQCDYRTHTIAVRVDDRPIRNLRCEMGMSVGIENALAKMLQGSHQMILETETELGGRDQYKFNTSGLAL